MAIEQKYSTNAAVQYNEVLTNYLINDASANKKFLTNAPLNRLIRENELSALYFLIDDAYFVGSSVLKFKDAAGNLIYEDYVSLGSTFNIHNGLLIGFSGVPYFVPSDTAKICAVISSNANVFNNPNFIGGTGDLFTSWTLTQPSRTNKILNSQEFDKPAWGKNEVSITADAEIAQDGTMTADVVTPSTSLAEHWVFQAKATIGIANTMSVYAKPNGYVWIAILMGGKIAYFNVESGELGFSNGGSASIKLDDNGFCRCIFTHTATNTYAYIFICAADNEAHFVGDGIRGGILWGAQLEDGANATPYAPTTNAAVTTSLGEFLQDATGGVDGGRAMKLWADVGGITFASQTRTLATTNYVFKAWAKIIDTGVTNPKIGLVINGVDVGRSAVLTTTYQWIEIPFAATAGTYAEAIFYENDENYGFAIIDNVSIRRAVDTEITEERCFELDTRCFQTENTIQWVNKLGGVDTWTFTGNPIETRNTEREGLIEYPMQDNYQSPNEIYAYRSIKSHEVINLFHRCENEETAIWLRSELQDAIQAYVKVGDDYHPIIPTTSSVQIRNYAQRDPNVRFTFRFAYDINIQRR